MFKLTYLILIVYIISRNTNIQCQKHNKYSAEANLRHKDPPTTVPLNKLEQPFRMAKINKLWSKAQIHGLAEPKLKSLYLELQLHDKEELTWKRLKLEGKDKEGLQEAELRKKLLSILNKYGLLGHFPTESGDNKAAQDKVYNEATDERIDKSLFKDKKLNKLWSKAETAGFSTLELQALREEFMHYQEKIDEYYTLLHDVKEGPKDQDENSIDETLDVYNTITAGDPDNKDYLHKINMIRDMNTDIRGSYDRLQRLSAKGPNSKEFVEPKVQGLWKIALDSDFGLEELESLRVELLHYENRLLKLRNLQAQAAVNEKYRDKMMHDKSDKISLLKDNIKKQTRKVEKIHLDLETRIMEKHIEL